MRSAVDFLESRLLLSVSSRSYMEYAPWDGVSQARETVIASDSAEIVGNQVVEYDLTTGTERVLSLDESRASADLDRLVADFIAGSRGEGLPQRATPDNPDGTLEPSDYIFGADARTRVAHDSLTTYPYRTVGRLWSDYGAGGEGACTGTMISPYHVLTAGHCVNKGNGGAWASTVIFSAGQDNDAIGASFRRSEYQPYGEATGVWLRSYTNWTADGDWDHDFALVTLDRRLGNFTGWFGYGYNTDDDFYEDSTANTSGYPGDLTPGVYDMYYQSGNAADYDITDNTLQTNTMDIWPGQSGSSVYYFNGDNRIAHAVVSSQWTLNGVQTWNQYKRITEDNFDDLGAWRATDDNVRPPTDRADLVDWDQWFNASASSFGPGVVKPGSSLSVTSYPRNNGTAAAGAFTVRYRLSTDRVYDTSDAYLGDVAIGGLGAYSWTTASLTSNVPSIGPGSYYLVWSVDAYNEVVEYSGDNNTGASRTLVTILLPDDHGDGWSNATAINVPSLNGGVIDTLGDLDYFQFVAGAGIVYQFQTHLGTLDDSTLALYGTDGVTLLAFNDDNGAELRSFIEWTAPATGTYFLQVAAYSHSYTGSYSLELSASDDYGNDAAASAFFFLPGALNGAIEINSDVDFFQFNAVAGEGYAFETALGSLPDSTLTIYDVDGVSVQAFNDDRAEGNLSSLVEWTAPASGTYFVAARSYNAESSGTYTLYGRALDDHFDTFDVATNTSVASYNFGTIEVLGDLDMFRFQAAAGATYRLETFLGGLTDSTLTLFAADGVTPLAFNDDRALGDLSSFLEWTAPALDYYYVRVASFNDIYTGSYALQLTALDDHGGDAGAASFAATPGIHAGIIESLGDGDFFAFAAAGGATYRLQTELAGLFDSTITLYDTDGVTVLAFDDDGGDELSSLLDWTAPVNGIYYVQVASYGSFYIGGYTLELTATDDHGGDALSASFLPVTGSLFGIVETFGDRDVFAFSAIQGETYNLTAYALELFDSTLTIYDQDGLTPVAFDDDNGPDLSAFLSWTAPSTGVFYAAVDGFSSSYIGSYVLEAIALDDHGDLANVATFVSAPNVVGGNLELLGDPDFFAFSAAAGATYRFETLLGSLLDSTLTLYGTDGATQLAFNDDRAFLDLSSQIDWTAPATGVYYLRVASYNDEYVGSYSLGLYAFDDHANVAAGATMVPAPGTMSGILETGADLDVFRFDAQAGVTYNLQTHLGDLADSTITLLDVDGATVLAFDDDGGDGLASLVTWQAPANGTYFVQVASYAGSYLGNYSFEVSEFVAIPAEMHGVAFNDLNGNAIQDGAEGPLVGWTVYLDLDNSGGLNAGDLSTTTSASGAYSFVNVAPGSYTLAHVALPGWESTVPGGLGAYSVNLASGAVLTGLNFGSRATLVGDSNGDGAVDLNDLNTVRNNFGSSGPAPLAGDTNGDGTIDLTDLNNVRNHFGETAPAPLLRVSSPLPHELLSPIGPAKRTSQDLAAAWDKALDELVASSASTSHRVRRSTTEIDTPKRGILTRT